MRLYMKFRQTDAPPLAAAKTSISAATAYLFEHDHKLPSHNQQVRGRRCRSSLRASVPEQGFQSVDPLRFH
jgi:hypothetical protein